MLKREGKAPAPAVDLDDTLRTLPIAALHNNQPATNDLAEASIGPIHRDSLEDLDTMLVDLRLQIEELKANNLQHTSDIEDLRRRLSVVWSGNQMVLGPVVANLVKEMAKLVDLITTSKPNTGTS
jgi:hypothetical protein